MTCPKNCKRCRISKACMNYGMYKGITEWKPFYRSIKIKGKITKKLKEKIKKALARLELS